MCCSCVLCINIIKAISSLHCKNKLLLRGPLGIGEALRNPGVKDLFVFEEGSILLFRPQVVPLRFTNELHFPPKIMQHFALKTSWPQNGVNNPMWSKIYQPRRTIVTKTQFLLPWGCWPNISGSNYFLNQLLHFIWRGRCISTIPCIQVVCLFLRM